MRKLYLLIALILTGCGGQVAAPVSQGNPSVPIAATRTPRPALGATSIPTAAQPTSPPGGAQPTSASIAPTAIPALATATTPPAASPVAPTPPGAGRGAILFNRQGAVWRYDLASGAETQVLPAGTFFRVSPDGSRLAYLVATTLYVAERDGSNPIEVAQQVAEAPAWAPDSTALAVTTGVTPRSYPISCTAASQIVVIELPAATSRVVGAGCQPAWAPESKRIAYITPVEGSANEGFNRLRLVNRQGANGWTPVSGPVAGDGYPAPRRIFYAPFWRGDGKQIYAFGFVGYQALSDFSTVEVIDPTNGGADPIGVVLDVSTESVRASTDGSQVAFMVNSPKGTSFVASLFTQAEPDIFDYVGTPVAISTKQGPGLEYASSPAWSPDGRQLAVVYCQSAGSICPPAAQAEVWLLDSATSDSNPIIKNVDGDSQLEWQP